MLSRLVSLGAAVAFLTVLGGIVYELARAQTPAQILRIKETAKPKTATQPTHALAKVRPVVAPVVEHDVSKLPQAVREMIDLMMVSVRSGSIEDLRTAVEFNELRPEVAQTKVADPIDYWKKSSVDGAGLEVLAALGNVLEAGFAAIPQGADLENNSIYVWPYLAEVAFKDLSPAQQVDLLRLVPPSEFSIIREEGRYRGWRLAIGADGTWHSFRRID